MQVPVSVFGVSIFLIFSTGLAREYHVSVNGDDGQEGSLQQPLRTISKAADLAQPGDLVTVHSGIYREWVKPPRGGDSDARRIVYQAASGKQAEIRGSEVVKGWEKVSHRVWKVTLPHAFFGDYNPYEEIIQGDWFDPMGREHHTGEVYLNGAPLWEAAALDEVFQPRDEDQYWYSRVESAGTTLWGDFGELDPNAEMVEINVRPACFYAEVPGVNYITVRGFKLRHAATQWAPPTAEQIGLIGTHWSKGWIIEDNEISDSRCSGITLGKYHDPRDRTEASADQYNETIRLALKNGWSRARIGAHIVRNNKIYRCEQAGICGSMGAIFSVVSGNHIHDIWVKRQFRGAEIGGIKFHGAIDTLISNNRIHRAGRGLWLDWMTQGTRVSGNLFYENTTDDLFLEVNHGPFMVDNNIFLSEIAVRNWSEGGAFVHNLVAGEVVLRPEPNRATPFQRPHSTEVAGLSITRGGDDRWFNNLFVGHNGLSPYDGVELPVRMDGNVFSNGAKPSKFETAPFTDLEEGFVVRLFEQEDRVFLIIEQKEAQMDIRSKQTITTKMLGKARLADQGYTNVDGSALVIDTDYFGNQRNESKPVAGPLAIPMREKHEVKVWEK